MKRMLAVLAFVAAETVAMASQYGVCSHLTYSSVANVGRETAEIKRYGLGWVRCDFDWDHLGEGTDRFVRWDRVVSEATSNRVAILGILSRAPKAYQPYADHIDEWGSFVRETVSRYKDSIRAWEVMNEANWKGVSDEIKNNPEVYAQLLKRAYEEIKRIDPEIIVTCTGYAGVFCEHYQGKLYELGMKDYFDVMNVHWYELYAQPEKMLDVQLDRLKKFMKKNGDDNKPIWVTEFGFATGAYKFCKNGRKFNESVTEKIQGEMATRVLAILCNEGVEKMLWYNFRDFRRVDDCPFDREKHFGMIRQDYTAKDAALAVKTFIKMRPSGSVQRSDVRWRPAAGASDNLWTCEWTRPDGRKCGLVWVERNESTVEMSFIKHKDRIRFFNHLGVEFSLASRGDNTYRFVVTGAPVYFVDAWLDI